MADTKHNLVTKGAWVKLRPYSDLRAKHRKRALAGRVGAVQYSPDGKPLNLSGRLTVMAGLDLAEDVAAMCVTAWNIPYLPGAELPDDHPELIGELTIEDNNKLLELTEDTRRKLLADPKPVDPSDHADPASPSKPESD